MVGHGGSSAGSYLTDPTSPIPSHCASIVATSTVRVDLCVVIGEKSPPIQMCPAWYVLHSFAVGKLYHHSMFHNPTAAVNLFHVGKEYLTFCKA